MVRLEVSSSAAMASAVTGRRVRRSTWMIWNSRSARRIGEDPSCQSADRVAASPPRSERQRAGKGGSGNRDLPPAGQGSSGDLWRDGNAQPPSPVLSLSLRGGEEKSRALTNRSRSPG